MNEIKAIKTALKNIDRNYCKLSQLDYSKIGGNETFIGHLKEEKYLERPFAYEFYHQLRKLMESGRVQFGKSIIQAEVDKRYQHCFSSGKIPDFIIHVPNTKSNLAVIEFKLASNLGCLRHDFEKLFEFKTNMDLRYTHVIEVIIDDNTSIEAVKERVEHLNNPEGEEILIIEFNTDLWEVNDWKIKYKIVRNVA